MCVCVYIYIYISREHTRSTCTSPNKRPSQTTVIRGTLGSPRLAEQPGQTSPNASLAQTPDTALQADGSSKDDDFPPTPFASREFNMEEMQKYYLTPAGERDKKETDRQGGQLDEEDSDGHDRHDDDDASRSSSVPASPPSTEVAAVSVSPRHRRVSLTRQGGATGASSPLSIASSGTRVKTRHCKDAPSKSQGIQVSFFFFYEKRRYFFLFLSVFDD